MMEEVYLHLDLIRSNPGFSIDIGCSLGKLIYRPKSLYKNGEIISEEKIKKNKFGPLYLRTFDRGDIDGLVKIIREECDFTARPRQEVLISGLGSSAAKQRLEEALNISLTVTFEHDNGVDAINFLHRSLGPEGIFLPEPPGAREEAVHRFKIFQTWLKAGEGKSRVKWDLLQDQEEALAWQPDEKADIFPYLLIIGGSLFTMSKVDINGSIININALFFSGRFIMGLLATLTGERDFDRLIKMAEESDGATTDIFASELMKMDLKTEGGERNEGKEDEGKQKEGKEEETDFYTAIKGDLLMFPFGKPASSDVAAKKGDMVRSVLETACSNLALVVQMTAAVQGCKHVFFAGSFMSAPLIQKMLAVEMIRKNLESPVEKRVDFRFVRHGGYMTSIGSYLEGSKKQLRGPRK